MSFRSCFAACLLLSSSLFLLSCSQHSDPSPVSPSLTDLDLHPELLSATVDDGMTEGALGVFWLTRDPDSPTQATLDFARSGEAQGDLYALSIRPFLNATSLTLLSSTPGPGSTTDYTLRFRHPYAIPANFTPPSTSTKRMDLFLFDVNLLLAVSGSDTYFSNTIKTNVTAMPSPSGYRQIGPLFDLAPFGISNGTNVFPYQLVASINATTPAGNYDKTNGWLGNEWLAPTGYDVVPQGASVNATMRIANAIPSPLPIVVLAKYMDPRKGTTTVEKRASRLPSATDPTKLRYFLPEACGDLSRITLAQVGTLTHTTSTELVTVTATVLDWDNASTKAATFPNAAELTQVAEVSKPTQCEASFPLLKAAGTFAGTVVSTPTGVIKESIDVLFGISNVDKTVIPPDSSGIEVPGILRIRDTQDGTNPAQIILDEALIPQTAPVNYEPSTRYQALTVHVAEGIEAPEILIVAPSGGATGSVIAPVATNIGGPATSWSWNFGGGATPNTSISATPSITLNAVGSYSASVTATNATGSDVYPFTLTVTPPLVPTITNVSPTSGFARRSHTLGLTTINGTPTSWSWNFGGGAVPNVSTLESPTITLGLAGTYNATVTATNAFGSSAPFPFTLTVNNKLLGLRMKVVTSGGTLPGLLYNLGAWNATNAWNWINTYVNPIYVSSGVQFDQSLFTYATFEYPAIFNVDTGTEHNWVMANIYDEPADKLNLYFVNSAPWYPNLGGVAGDASCNPNNVQRGCYAIPDATISDVKTVAHELGHVMYLPHIRITTPVIALNNNLMSYYTENTTLSPSISADTAFIFCWLHNVNPMDQPDLVNDWCWQYLP